jgi:hypothetical protein
MFKDLFNSNVKDDDENNNEKANLFKRYLKEKDVNMDNEVSEDRFNTFVTYQSIKNGPTIRVVIMFDPAEISVYFYVFDYLNIEEEKKLSVMDLINKINKGYMFTTFYLSEDLDVHQKFSMDVEEVFSPITVFNQAVIMVQQAEEQYKKFMGIVWSD